MILALENKNLKFICTLAFIKAILINVLMHTQRDVLLSQTSSRRFHAFDQLIPYIWWHPAVIASWYAERGADRSKRFAESIVEIAVELAQLNMERRILFRFKDFIVEVVDIQFTLRFRFQNRKIGNCNDRKEMRVSRESM
jgi:hypothetical protein